MSKRQHSDDRPLLAALAVALLGVGTGWSQPAPGFQISQPPTTSGAALSIRSNEAAFSRGFGLTVKVDPTRFTDEKLVRHIRALPLNTTNGVPLSARDYRAAEQIIVGATEGAVSINHVENTATGKNLFVSFRDPQGRFTRRTADQIGLFDLRGTPRCFDLKRMEEMEHAVEVDLVLDRSGSMESHLPAVKAAATRFMHLMPASARCRVTSFNSTYTHHTQGYRSCSPSQHDIESIRAGGGTDIFGVLAVVYDEIDQRGDDHQRAVVVVTDGLGTSTDFTKQMMQAKKSAVTFVYWLGDYDETALKGLADEYIYGRAEVRTTLERYFGSSRSSSPVRVAAPANKKRDA